MMTRTALAVAAMALGAGAAQAHHSGSMFDATRTVTIKGTVTEFRWASPHAWIYLKVPGPGGTVDYAAELSSINIIARRGWSKASLAPGEKVELSAHPMRDGTASGLLLTLKLPDGKVLADHDY